MANVMVPISVGELVDKITILRIKERMISDPKKLENITTELNSLVKVALEAGLDLGRPEVSELESINLKLWKIEDDIREKERQKQFDDDFIELARAVYVTNDERFRVKSLINESTGSALREEKSYQSY